MTGLPPDHERHARSALPEYGRPEDGPLRLLSLSENATYLVDDGNPMVLRVHRPGYHSLAAIRSELSWMAALREQTTVRTPQLIRAGDGRAVVTTRPQPRIGSPSGPLYVDAVSYIPGCTAEHAPDAVGFEELGRMTAIMHEHVRGWAAPAYFTRFCWDVAAILGPWPRWGDWRLAPGLKPRDIDIVEKAAAEVARMLTEFGCGPDRFGLIHADLRMSNLMVDPAAPDRAPTVIDFDDCGWSWHLADLGAVVSFIEDTPAAETMIAGWVCGYRDVRELPDDHLNMIPTFVMLRRLMLTAWVASHADADAAIAFVDGYPAGTTRLAERYLQERDWLRDAAFASRS